MEEPYLFEQRVKTYLWNARWEETADSNGATKYKHPELASKAVGLETAVFRQMRQDVKETNNSERLARALRGARVTS